MNGNRDPYLIKRLPGDVIRQIDQYLNYGKYQELFFVNLIRFYIRQTGGEYLSRQEFEEEWYISWRNLTQFFRRHKLNFDVYYLNKQIEIDYNRRDLITDKIIHDFIVFIVENLGSDPEIAEDLNLVLKKNNSYFRVIVMGEKRHHYFEITKIVPNETSVVNY